MLQVVTEKLEEVKSLVKELGKIGKAFIPGLAWLLYVFDVVCYMNLFLVNVC